MNTMNYGIGIRPAEFIFPPFDSGECHASSLTELPGGEMMAAWFAGSREGKTDVRIYWSRRHSDGSWTAPMQIPAVGNEPHWNPVLFTMPDGRIFLFFKVGATIPQWHTFCCHFSPDRQQWSSPAELVPGDHSGGRGPVKNKPILLSNGTLLAPASVERGQWRAFVERSEDGGKSWTRSDFIPTPAIAVKDEPGENQLGVIQPSLWESAPGNVHMLLRSNHRMLYRSDSADYGKTWSPARPTVLPNNNSGIDLVRLEDGRLFLSANCCDQNWGPRNHLELLHSYDNGENWSPVCTLAYEPIPALPAEKAAEFSYPAIIALRNRNLAVSYTWKRKSICFRLITPY